MSDSALQLLQGLGQDGALGATSVMAFQNMGDTIQAGLGIPVGDIEASEVFLVGKVIDDSSSISWIKADPNDPQPMNGPEAVCFGTNLIDTALQESKSSGDVLTSTRLLNRGLVDAFTPLAGATRLENGRNYSAYGGTPLYDQVIAMVGSVMAKMREFEDAGVPVRASIVIVTDGVDYGSSASVQQVESVIKDAIRSENVLIHFVGIKDDQGTDFVAIAQSMGIPDKFVLTPGKSASEIRQAMHVVSQSNVRASQGGAGFSQAAASGLGGFGA